MSLTFQCAAPADLLRNFKAKINQTEAKGKIDTWEISDDGRYFTHKAPRWRALAWFWAEEVGTGLRFNIAPSQGQTVTTEAYAYYHGHLTETFLNHFDQNFRVASSTAQVDTNDRVK